MTPLNSSLMCSPAKGLHASQEGTFKCAHRRAKQRCKAWYFGTWNVCSLVDNKGTVETARLSSERGESEDRRIDLVIGELDRYSIKVAALQETMWFGSHVYHVGKSVVLTAGRETPQEHQPRQRGEGVAIVLTGHAITAWKAGGEQWRAWGSRIVKATLGGGNQNSTRIHILSCYAPTFGASRTEKDLFFDHLQEALDEVPPNETYIVLGDFNARVGSRSPAGDDHWDKCRGPNGFGELNDAGRDLLHFLSLNEATVCNTWFKKKDIYKCTWQHPKSKKWHCIDHAIVRAKDRRKCLDASVKRGVQTTNYSVFGCACPNYAKPKNQLLLQTGLMCPNWPAGVWMRMGQMHLKVTFRN